MFLISFLFNSIQFINLIHSHSLEQNIAAAATSTTSTMCSTMTTWGHAVSH